MDQLVGFTKIVLFILRGKALLYKLYICSEVTNEAILLQTYNFMNKVTSTRAICVLTVYIYIHMQHIINNGLIIIFVTIYNTILLQIIIMIIQRYIGITLLFLL